MAHRLAPGGPGDRDANRPGPAHPRLSEGRSDRLSWPAMSGPSDAARPRPPAPPRLPEALDGRDDQPARDPGQRSSRFRSWPWTILQASTFEIALLNVVEFLPFLLIGLPAGVWVDRLRRRPILIAGDLGRAARPRDDPARLRSSGVLTIFQLYVVGFVVGVLTVFFDVAYQSYLPSLVERDQLQEGNAKLEISRAGAQVVGPGLAGVLIGLLAGAVRGRPRRPLVPRVGALPVPDPAAGAGARARMPRTERPRPGMRARDGRGPPLRARPPVPAEHRGLHRDLEPLRQRRRRGPARLRRPRAGHDGGRRSASPSRSGAIGRPARRRGRQPDLERGSGSGRRSSSSPRSSGRRCCPVALAPVGTPQPVLVGLVALFGFVGGLRAVVYNVAQVSLRQAITPARMQGRMNATMRWIVWGTIPIGGIARRRRWATCIGVRETILLGALGEIAGVPAGPASARCGGSGRCRRPSTTRPPATKRRRGAAGRPSLRRRRPASGPGRRAPGPPRSRARSPRRRGGSRPSRVGRQHPLQLLGGEVRAVGHDDHPGVLAVPDPDPAAVVDRSPRSRRPPCSRAR